MDSVSLNTPVSQNALTSALEHPAGDSNLPKDLDTFSQKFMSMMLDELRKQVQKDQQETQKADQHAKAAIYGQY